MSGSATQNADSGYNYVVPVDKIGTARTVKQEVVKQESGLSNCDVCKRFVLQDVRKSINKKLQTRVSQLHTSLGCSQDGRPLAVNSATCRGTLV